MSTLDESIDRARRKSGLAIRVGYLGDGTGVTRDPRTPGNLWVRFQTSDGFTAAVSYPVDPNANLIVAEGLAVDVGFSGGRERILRANVSGTIDAGINPAQLNPLDDDAHGATDSLMLSPFFFRRHVDTDNEPLTISVYPQPMLVSGVLQEAGRANIDVSAYVPTTGQFCWVVIFWNVSTQALEALASTAYDLGSDAPAALDLVNECIASSDVSVDSPICGVYLADDQGALDDDAQHWVDLRQFINIPGSSGTGIRRALVRSMMGL